MYFVITSGLFVFSSENPCSINRHNRHNNVRWGIINSSKHMGLQKAMSRVTETKAIPHVIWSFKLIFIMNHSIGKLFSSRSSLALMRQENRQLEFQK